MTTTVDQFGVTADDIGNAGRIERDLLACLLRSDETGCIDDVAALVRPDDFAHHVHQVLFRAMISLRASNVLIALDTVFQQVMRDGRLADLGPQPGVMLTNYWQSQPSGALALYYANEVRDASRLRALKRAHLEMGRELAEPSESVAELAARCERIVFEASGVTATASGPRSVSDLAREEMFGIESRMNGSAPTGLSTGFDEVDRLLGGMRPGQMIVVGARPGVGKTAISLAIAANVAEQGTPTLFVSLEMSNGELTQRLISLRSGVPLKAIRDGSLTPAHVDKLHHAEPVVRKLPMLFEDTPGMTADRLAATARRAVRRNGVGLIVIDYLQLVTPENPRENRNAQIGLLARRLKLLARECGLPVIVLSQLNRETENRPDPKPRLSDLRDSGEVEQHSDAVLLLSEQRGPGADERVQLVDCDIAKNRSGPVGTVTLRRVKALTRFENAPF